MTNVINAYIKKKLRKRRKKMNAGFVVKPCLKGDGFSARIRVPAKMNTTAGQKKLAIPRFHEKGIHGKTKTTLQLISLVFDDGASLIFYLSIEDWESNFPSRLL